MTYGTVTSPAVGDLFTAAWAQNVSDDVNVLVAAAPSSVLPGQVIATVNSATAITSAGATETLHTGLLFTVTNITAGRNYFIDLSGRLGNSAAAGKCVAYVRALQGTVTITSPVVALRQTNVAANTNVDDFSVRQLWVPAASGSWSFQATVQGAAAQNATLGPHLTNAYLTLTAA